MYADDLVIYGQATNQEAEVAFECLQQYCDWTGQVINWQKSSIHFSGNTFGTTKRDICRILKMEECNHTGSYLGHHFYKFHSRSAAFQSVMEKMANKLSGWKRRTLSMARRLVLAKSVIQALPIFLMQYLMSKSQVATVDQICRCFLWGASKASNRKYYPIGGALFVPRRVLVD